MGITVMTDMQGAAALLPQASVTVHVIVDIPGLNIPLALLPDPFRVVAPVTWYVIVRGPLQLSEAISRGIE